MQRDTSARVWREQENMCVRHMDWADDLKRLQGKEVVLGSKGTMRDEVGEIVPEVDASETFDVIIGSDILYEVCHCSAAMAEDNRNLHASDGALPSVIACSPIYIKAFELSL